MRIILIIYANDSMQRLSFLEKESKAIQHVLNSFLDKNFEVKILPAASPQDLLNELKVHGEKVEVLHYSGHANGNELALMEQGAAGSHLADVLKVHCPNLKFLFLNGCNTQAQVSTYHEAGISNVIATNAPIKDDESFAIAKEFYTYLVNGKDTTTAFEALKSNFQLLKKQVNLNVYRGLVLLKKETEFEWNLYILDGQTKPYQLPKQIEEDKPRAIITQTADKIYNIDHIDKANFS